MTKIKTSLFLIIVIGFSVFHLTSKKSDFIELKADSALPFSSLIRAKNTRAPASVHENEIVIEQGDSFYLDQSLEVDTLIVNGELHCDPKYAADKVELKAKTIIIKGVFQCGTPRYPYKKKLIISLKHSDSIPAPDHRYRGILVSPGGKLILHGNSAKSGWYKLTQTAYPGDNYIEISNSKEFDDSKDPYDYFDHKWQIGDKIVIGPTGYNPFEAEEFKITSVEGSRIYLDNKIKYQHWGELSEYRGSNNKKVIMDERAEVANLSRSILIRADEEDGEISEGDGEADQIGAHIMAHHKSKLFVDSVELYKMGQAGIMARYPIHWHYVGDADDQYIVNSSIHHSFQRCLAIHRTNNVLVRNNVCYNFKGHGYFLEDGTEQGNIIHHNLAILAKAPSKDKILLASDDVYNSEDQGRFPSVSGFWISHPNNDVTHNVVSGSVGTGIWMSFEEEVKNSAGAVVARPINAKTLAFNFNEAHTCKVGITWDGASGPSTTNNPRNPQDTKLISAHYAPSSIPTFIGLRAWKNTQTGIYFRGQSALFKNSIVSDNGWSFWLAYNQIVKDSIFIGESDNQSRSFDVDYFKRAGRKRKGGIVLYDGPFEMHDSEFLNFPTKKKFCSNRHGNGYNCTTVPIISAASTNKFTNIASGIYFNPYPIYRAYLESPQSEFESYQLMGNSVIRDLDGSISGTGKESVIVGTRSLGKTGKDNCISGDETFVNFDVCPSQYSEGSFAFMRWGALWRGISPWQSHFVVLRSDGETNYPIKDWPNIRSIQNNLFATSNDPQISYTLMSAYNYKKDKENSVTVRIDFNSENANQHNPIVQIKAYGNNCKLIDAKKTSSLKQLKQSNETAYYSKDEDFFVKLVPTVRWFPIEESPLVNADAIRTKGRYAIKCDETPLKQKVIGKVESVERNAYNTIIKGYACNFTKDKAIKVKAFAFKENTNISSKNSSRPGKTKDELIYIGQALSNLTPDPQVSVACGIINRTPPRAGNRFRIIIPNSSLANLEDYEILVKGISMSEEPDKFLASDKRFFISIN